MRIQPETNIGQFQDDADDVTTGPEIGQEPAGS